ncbi:hypothetical protein [Bradyrhizobium sp. LA7.1]|uniref:hypothetical protein n=1 Tax=Bradyrhizobium sp. LA7.1 TaxID=3156324 RepID=UPI0033922534
MDADDIAESKSFISPKLRQRRWTVVVEDCGTIGSERRLRDGALSAQFGAVDEYALQRVGWQAGLAVEEPERAMPFQFCDPLVIRIRFGLF